MTAIFAHRGVTSDAGAPAGLRENTTGAFEAARRAGADGVELDVRLSRDATPVVHHDGQLPSGQAIADADAATLPPWLPSLATALASCRGLALNVELKRDPEADPGRLPAQVAAVLAGRCVPMDARSPAAGPGTPAGPPRVLVSSFDPPSLAAMRSVAPALPVGLLCDWRTDPRRALADALALGCASLHPFVTQVDAAVVGEVRSAGLALHVWGVNAPGDLAAMAALGVAAVITDRVDTALAQRRAQAAPNGEAPPG